jgi:cytochrome c-type biogenesis protein CcmH
MARLVIVLLAASTAWSGAWAQDQAVDTKASQLFDEVMSPFCPGRTLANCPSPRAATLRDQIKERLAAGATGEEIVDSLYAVYGDIVLGAPRPRGFGLLAWIVPGVFVLAGAGVLIWWITSTKRLEAPDHATDSELDPAAQARLESELSQL